MPPGLYEQVTVAAEAAGRSMNSEILHRLGGTFDVRWQEYIAKLDERERREREALELWQNDPAWKEWVRENLPKMKLKDGTTIGEHMKKLGKEWKD
jgi:hypothetical protein